MSVDAMRVRIANAADAPAIAAIYAPYVTDTAITFELDPPTPAEIEARMTAGLAHFPWLVAEAGNEIAGYVYAGRFSGRAAYDWSAEITVYLNQAFHRRGLGKRLYAVLIELLKLQQFHAMFAGITLPNDASIGLHRKIGMAEVGVYREAGFKLGKWHDVAWFGQAIAPASPPETKPIPFSRLQQTHSALIDELLAGPCP